MDLKVMLPCYGYACAHIIEKKKIKTEKNKKRKPNKGGCVAVAVKVFAEKILPDKKLKIENAKLKMEMWRFFMQNPKGLTLKATKRGTVRTAPTWLCFFIYGVINLLSLS